MQLIIDKKALVEELQLCGSVTEKKTTIPILGTLKLEADQEGLAITGTDLECAIQSKVDAQVAYSGSICLPAARLVPLVRSLPEGDIRIAVSDKMWATITAGKTKARIAGTPVDNFPAHPPRPDPVAVMGARLLAHQIGLVRYAITVEESRFTLNGFLLEIGDSAVCIATDSHRMVWTCGKLEEKTVPNKILVPKVATGILPKLTEGSAAGSKVEISVDDNHIYFAVENRLLCTRKLAGSFPDYHRVLPKGQLPCMATVNRKAMIEALGSVVNFSDAVTKFVRTELRGGEVALSSASIEVGECDTAIDAEGNGEMHFGMNGQYILDVFSSLASEKVEIWGTNERSAVEFRPAGESNYRCVIMPMRR